MPGEIARLELSRPVLTAGTPIDRAAAAVVLLHGRGASARDILQSLLRRTPAKFAHLAPEAPGQAWYPQAFNVPIEQNEPYLSASLAVVSEVVSHLEGAGIEPRHVILYGFSQGACLALEYAARNPQRYGGVVGLSGGLIGPDDLEREAGGTLEGTPVFLGCGDPDAYVPRYRVESAAGALGNMGAEVTLRFYAGLGHAINQDELEFVRDLMERVGAAATGA